MTDRRSNFLAWVLVGGSAFLLFLVAVFAAVYFAAREEEGFLLGGDRVGLIMVEGVILDSRATVEELERFGKDPGIRALVLRLNSPGGAVAPSQEIYAAVRRLRLEKKKPVWASVGVVGASGAYYIACAADRVYANPGSIIGSIGVIAEWYNYGELLKWAKMKDVVFKAGKFKDTGSPTREMTPEERAYFQQMADDLHSQFIGAVAQGRRMKLEQVRPLADGRVFTGQQAARLGLVDGTADLEQVIREAARAAGIRGEPRVVTPPRERHTLLGALLDGVARLLPPALQPAGSLAAPYQGPVWFQYLWR